MRSKLHNDELRNSKRKETQILGKYKESAKRKEFRPNLIFHYLYDSGEMEISPYIMSIITF